MRGLNIDPRECPPIENTKRDIRVHHDRLRQRQPYVRFSREYCIRAFLGFLFSGKVKNRSCANNGAKKGRAHVKLFALPVMPAASVNLAYISAAKENSFFGKSTSSTESELHNIMKTGPVCARQCNGKSTNVTYRPKISCPDLSSGYGGAGANGLGSGAFRMLSTKNKPE